jgi:hypothetical protein
MAIRSVVRRSASEWGRSPDSLTVGRGRTDGKAGIPPVPVELPEHVAQFLTDPGGEMADASLISASWAANPPASSTAATAQSASCPGA